MGKTSLANALRKSQRAALSRLPSILSQSKSKLRRIATQHTLAAEKDPTSPAATPTPASSTVTLSTDGIGINLNIKFPIYF